MGIEDEYIRDYSFEPEFITRKDSLEMHRSRLERTRKHNKMFSKTKTSESVDLERTHSIDQLTSGATQNILEAELDAFKTVMRDALIVPNNEFE